MSERAFVARYSPWRTLLGIAGCLGFVALGLFLGGAFGGFEAPSPLVGYSCAAVFGGFCLVGVTRIGRRGPALQIDAVGIRQWLGSGERLVPWSAVVALEEVAIRRQRFLYLWLDEPDRWLPRRAFGDYFGHLSLSIHATDRRFAELRAAVQRFAPARLTSTDAAA